MGFCLPGNVSCATVVGGGGGVNGVEENLALKYPLWCYYQDGHELPPPIGFDLPSEESLPASKVLCCYIHRMCFFVVVKLTTDLSKLVEL